VRRVLATLAAGCFVIGVVATAALWMEVADVVLSVQAQRVSASLDLTGGPAEGPLPTQELTVKVTATLDGTASPATVGATYATGAVVFTYYSSCTSECYVMIRVPPGSELSTDSGLRYVTLADEWFRTTSRPVPVRAVQPGTSGNTGAHTIVNFGYNEAPGLVVTNPGPISGGTDRQTHVITPADYRAVETAVMAEAIHDANRAMRVKAGGLGYGVVGPPILSEKSSDAVGAETQVFTITVTATLEAYAFFDSAIRGQVQSAVKSRVRPDQELTADSIEVDYRIASLQPDGEITIHADGTGFVVPRIHTQALQSRIAGLDLTDARAELRSAVRGATVSVRMWPVGLPRLPQEARNIRIRLEVRPAPA
jgi:Baseplate J-like protein